jgi:hypothetical protein
MPKTKATATPRPPKVERSASTSGYHFYNLYQCCERKAYIRFGPPRLEYMFTAPPLVLGGAFHAGKALFYTSRNESKALALVASEIKLRKADLESRDEYLAILDRGPAMLASWFADYGRSDLKHLTIVDVERAFKVPFPGNPKWFYTGRVDMIADDKYGNRLIYETKTSSWSIKSTLINVIHGDQTTGYIWGAQKLYKKLITAIIPDITFLSSNAKTTERVTNQRGEFVYRDQVDIDFFARSMSQKASEISQKMKAVYAGHDPAVFARNGYYCNAYNRPCEYADICRQDLNAKTKVPNGFKRNPGRFKISDISSEIDDNLAGG